MYCILTCNLNFEHHCGIWKILHNCSHFQLFQLMMPRLGDLICYQEMLETQFLDILFLTNLIISGWLVSNESNYWVFYPPLMRPTDKNLSHFEKLFLDRFLFLAYKSWHKSNAATAAVTDDCQKDQFESQTNYHPF